MRDREHAVARGLSLRPLEPGDADELTRIHREPGVARWWGQPDVGFPYEEPAMTRLTILVDGAIAGMIQYYEELEPRYRYVAIDLFLDPAVHGHGHGGEAIRRVVRTLIDEHGHHRFTLDPAADNLRAIRAYEKIGFKTAGVMRQYERDLDGDGWHDALLMELIAGEELPVHE